jgi:EAL domain-containing protein (putative c-di-GMP-specific phosphodiesterase class I)
MDLLAAEGCHIGQGYFMSKPINEAALVKFIEKIS